MMINGSVRIELDHSQQAETLVSILDNYIQGLTLPVEPDKMKHYMREIYAEALSLESIE